MAHLFLIYELNFSSIRLLEQTDFALMGQLGPSGGMHPGCPPPPTDRVGNMNLGFISNLMRSLFEQSICTNKISS